MAAYDWGTGISSAPSSRTGYADFWELYKRNNLPARPKTTSPIILAAIIMAKNPKQYGLDDSHSIPRSSPTPSPSSTALICASWPTSSMPPSRKSTALNPSLLRLATPPETTFDLHLPAGTAAIFPAKRRPDPRKQAPLLALPQGRSRRRLASRSPQLLCVLQRDAAVNQLGEGAKLDGVESLVVPVAPSAAPLSAHRLQHHPPRRYPGLRR